MVGYYRKDRQNRESRNRAIQIWSSAFQQRWQSNSMGKGESLQQIILEQLAICMKMDKFYFTPCAKTDLKMDYKSKCQS